MHKECLACAQPTRCQKEGACLISAPAGLADRIIRMKAVCDAAENIVALWKSPEIAGLPRSQRNAAIEDSRAALIRATENL